MQKWLKVIAFTSAAAFSTLSMAALDASDLDADGVADHMDRCPNSQGKVNANGCPPQGAVNSVKQRAKSIDTDGDGVADADDICPDAVNNRAVDNNGCSVVAFYNASGVFFFHGGKHPKKSSMEVLNSTVDALKEALAKDRSLTLTVAGYGDHAKRGNLALAKTRAKFVQKFFIRQGIAADRLVVEAQPFLPAVNCTKDRVERCMERNRRVELMVR